MVLGWAKRLGLSLVVAVAVTGAFTASSVEAHRSSVYHWHYVELYPGYWTSCLFSPAGHVVYCP